MKQATRYIKDVQSGKEICCEFVKLAVARHVADLKRQEDKNWGFFFSDAHAQKAISFFRMLKHTAGKLAGQPFNLQDNQAFRLAMIFGWRQKEDGNRRFTQTYLEEGRKGGKSQEMAGIELFCGLCEGEESAEIYTAATTRDQADMIFRAAKKMARYLMQDSKAMKKAITVMAHSIVLPLTDSFIQKVSADAGTLDGLNPHCAVIEEYHAHKNDLVKGVMQTGQGSRSNPLLAIITTAGFNKDYPCYAVERKNAVAVLRGERIQENLFAVIFTLDDGDVEILMSLNPDDKNDVPKIISLARKSNPNLGSTPTEKYILDQLRDAKNKGTTTRVQVLTKNFNVWMDTPQIWIPEETVKSVMRPMELQEFAGRPCFAGIDLAATKDITALDLFFPPFDGLPAAGISYFFLPETTIKARQDDVQYAEWVEAGYIIQTPGNIADYAFLKKKLMEISEVVDLRSTSYDQWNSYQLVSELTQEGYATQLCRQNYGNLSEPCKKIEKMILAQSDYLERIKKGDGSEIEITHPRIELQESPVLLWMFRNVVLDFDAQDNIKPNKDKSPDKIDGVSAKAMSVFGWLTALSVPTVSSYLFDEESEILRI